MNIANLSADTLRRAAKIKDQLAGLERYYAKKLAKEKTKYQSQLSKLLGGHVGNGRTKGAKKGGRRKMSAAAKKALSVKLKAAWAKRKAAKVSGKK